MRIIATFLAFAFALALSACNEPDDSAYLAFAGGGFIFNYRIGQAYYGFVAKPKKTIPQGAVIQARFEVPGSDEPFIQRQPGAKNGMLQYAFKTPPLKGIVKDHKYKAELRVIDPGTSKVLATYDHSFLPMSTRQACPTSRWCWGRATRPTRRSTSPSYPPTSRWNRPAGCGRQ